MGAQETARVFVALELPQEASAYLTEVQHVLRRRLPEEAVRWSKPEGFHLTLAFLGNVSVMHLDKVHEAMLRAAQGIAPFTLHLSSFGCFPSMRHPSVLWVGVGGALEPLDRLQGRTIRALGSWLELDEGKRFKPHVTLGRVKARDRAAQRAVAQVAQEVAASPTLLLSGDEATRPSEVTWAVTHVSLVQSELRPQGSRYTTLKTVMLQATR